MTLVEWWWNGRWGGARRDLKLWVDERGGLFLEVRRGSNRYREPDPYENADAAQRHLALLRGQYGPWKRMT